MMNVRGGLLGLAIVLLSGCATIVGDKTQVIPITSSPSDATVLITDEKGVEVFKGNTPTSVVLKKSDGSYWGKKRYVLQIAKKGYEKQSIPIVASANGWYMFGNLVFGGLIGWFIVDPYNGAMYSLSPEQVSSHLGEKTAENYHLTDDGLAVVLIEDVPEKLRPYMKKIN